jgi:hypothetical protein
MDGWAATFDSLLDRANAAFGVVSAAAARGAAALDQQFGGVCRRWMALREANRQQLQALGGRLAATPGAASADRWTAFQRATQRYQDLAMPWDDATGQASTGHEVGIAPAVVLVVLGVGLSVSAIAWAWVSLSEQENLAAQIDLQGAELAARVEAMRTGTSLSPSTLPPPAPPSGAGWVIPALLGVGGLGAFLYWKTR